MTRVVSRVALPFALAAGAGAVLVATRGRPGFSDLGLAALVCASVLLEVQVPKGGSVPMTPAVVIALAYALPSDRYAVVVGVGLGIALPVLLGRHGVNALRRLAWTLVAAAFAGVTDQLLRQGLHDGGHTSKGALLVLIAGGVAFLAVELVGAHARRETELADVLHRQSWPVHVTLLSAAALLGLAYREGWWMLAIATLPLLVTRYSFQRYADARQTYEQTIQALGIVPELAGRVDLGHGERTAAYAAAVADEIGSTGAEREAIVTVARLHHIGLVAMAEEDEMHAVDDGVVAHAGAVILRESGFLGSIADILDAMDPTTDRRGSALPGAVAVHVASAFDDLVGEDARRAPDAIALLMAQADDETAAVVAALGKVFDSRPALVHDAIARAAPLTRAAAAAERRLSQG